MSSSTLSNSRKYVPSGPARCQPFLGISGNGQPFSYQSVEPGVMFSEIARRVSAASLPRNNFESLSDIRTNWQPHTYRYTPKRVELRIYVRRLRWNLIFWKGMLCKNVRSSLSLVRSHVVANNAMAKSKLSSSGGRIWVTYPGVPSNIKKPRLASYLMQRLGKEGQFYATLYTSSGQNLMTLFTVLRENVSAKIS
jgi:hypothetical protein